jgi:outer membrane immunogenic protein
MGKIKGVAVLGFVFAAVAVAAAQKDNSDPGVPLAQVAVHYTWVRANAGPGDCGCFNLNGGGAEFAVRAYRNFSAVVDVTGAHAASTSISGQSLGLLTYTAGPRYSYPQLHIGHTRITPFAQALFGAAHGFDGQFPNASGSLSASANSLAVQAGGGVDVELKHKFSLRVAQVEYGYTQLPNNVNDHESLFRFSAGVVFRLR